ncbi:carbonic anhydrase-like [Pecten maximus]|uniref:carbonic anhydrase-like n=1 Tax=Pecten maximus TaxID=6579 RepID=UPI0014583B70|nr:carbonic anhydrase-like [Pecten maximus]
MSSSIQTICLLLLGLLECSTAAGWHYGSHDSSSDPPGWATLPNSVCGGQFQSPINVPSVTKQDYSIISNFRLQGFSDVSKYTTTMKNNGHTLQVDVVSGDLTVAGGGLPGNTYKTAQLHFHWGHDNSDGSEHNYDGRPYPMEMHVVNYNLKYGSLGGAIDKSDGLAVLGFWVTYTTNDNAAFSPLISAIGNLTYKDTNTAVAVDIGALLPKRINRFYRYRGSLTTPPCFESVTWTMFEEKIFLSRQQLAKFRSVSEGAIGHSDPLVDNYRPVKALNGRKVLRNFRLEEEINSASHFSSIGMTLTIMITILRSFL